MTCPAAITRRYETREQVREYLASRGFQRTLEGGGTANGSDASAATMAASGSRSGCRPRSAPHSREGVMTEQGIPDPHDEDVTPLRASQAPVVRFAALLPLPAPIGPFGVGGIGEKASSACALHRGKLRA